MTNGVQDSVTLSTESLLLREPNPVERSRRCGELGSQLISNPAQGFASMEVLEVVLLGACDSCEALLTVSFSTEDAPQAALLQMVFDMTAVAWAFAYIQHLGAGLRAAIGALAARAGRELDRRRPPARRPPPPRGPPRGGAAAAPRLELRLRGAIVIFKPPAWEVDGRGSLCLEEGTGEGRLALSAFVQQFFPREEFPLPHWPDLDHGFLHRLDVPSSGLILAGTTFEGYHVLRLQLNTYTLRREYFVVCQEFMQSHLARVSLGIGSTTVRVRRSVADDSGKPAETYIKVESHSTLPHMPKSTGCSAVAIRIRTGRHHQIRTHLLHSGHPTITDAKYTVGNLYVCSEPC